MQIERPCLEATNRRHAERVEKVSLSGSAVEDDALLVALKPRQSVVARAPEPRRRSGTAGRRGAHTVVIGNETMHESEIGEPPLSL